MKSKGKSNKNKKNKKVVWPCNRFLTILINFKTK